MLDDLLFDRADAAITEARRLHRERLELVEELRFIAEQRHVMADGLHRWMKEADRRRAKAKISN
jgi:hypothetical protein